MKEAGDFGCKGFCELGLGLNYTHIGITVQTFQQSMPTVSE
jgi:hypothetical protein